MKMFAALCAAVWVMLPLGAAAQSNPVVVELFTSQGCSSCPPADKLMHKLAAREDVIALALHVDYWDYIGWKDEYADPANTKRQQGYAHQGGRRMVYTPQMIVNGMDDVVGARSMELADLINLHKTVPATVSVSADRTGAGVTIRARTLGAQDGAAMQVHLVRFTPERHAEITRGENAGRSLTYVNVVDGWTVLGEWDGQAPLEMNADAPGDRPIVVLIQRPGPGPIVAAVRID